LSVAVAVPVFTIALQSPAAAFTVIFAGLVITGFTDSFTVTVNVAVEILLDASFAVTVTVVVPVGNAVPEAGDEVTVTPGQLSVAAEVKLTTLLQPVVVVLILGEQLMTGFCTSFTVMVNEQLAPDADLTVTVVVPTGNHELQE
jgi:hypothetical protein